MQVRSVVAGGGLPHAAPLLLQIFADALQVPIRTTSSKQSGALGSAVFGSVAGGVFETVGEAVDTLSAPYLDKGGCVYPDTTTKGNWDRTYAKYLKLQELELELNRMAEEEG